MRFLKGHLVVVRLLLEVGAAVNGEDISRLGPLDYAIIGGNTDIFEVLVKNGALLPNTTTAIISTL